MSSYELVISSAPTHKNWGSAPTPKELVISSFQLSLKFRTSSRSLNWYGTVTPLIERRGPFTQALDGSRITNDVDIVSMQKRASDACRWRLGDSNHRRAWWWMDGDFICLSISDIDDVFQVYEEYREIRSDADQRSNISFPLATTRDLEWIHCDHSNEVVREWKSRCPTSNLPEICSTKVRKKYKNHVRLICH